MDAAEDRTSQPRQEGSAKPRGYPSIALHPEVLNASFRDLAVCEVRGQSTTWQLEPLSPAEAELTQYSSEKALAKAKGADKGKTKKKQGTTRRHGISAISMHGTEGISFQINTVFDGSMRQ